jgi:uncharacterized protein (DUF1800 family)
VQVGDYDRICMAGCAYIRRPTIAVLAAGGLIVATLASIASAGQGADIVALSGPELALLNRITWGANSPGAAVFAKLGANGFIEQQLHPPAESGLPPAAQAQIDAMTISATPVDILADDMDRQVKAANALADPQQKQGALRAYQDAMNRLTREAIIRSLLRNIYSPDQLKEQLTWFWMNHFNVFLGKANIRALIGDYEDRAIRPHVLGHFRDLLAATLHHPAMLMYLDNNQNAAGHINENYAREIMELHTLGVNAGYTQSDVQELARILTGVGVGGPNNFPKLKPELQGQYVRDGLFEFNPNRHDYGDKTFLGHRIAGRGLAEIDEALDILSRAPATSRFICRKLALFFVSDHPPAALVDRMAATFRETDGDIAAVLRVLFHAPEFALSLGTRVKDPIHYVVSAVRLAYDDRVVLNAAPMQGWLTRLAEPLYGRETPDGYPLTEPSWVGPGQLATRFEIARGIGSGSAGLFKLDGPGQTDRPAFPQIANALYYNSLRGTLNASTVATLDQAVSPQDWNTLFLASPEFMRR